MSNPVIVEEFDRKVVVRFNRPEVRSPLSVEVLNLLSQILDNIEPGADRSTVIFTGVGNLFASGADLREVAAVDTNGAREFALRGQRLIGRISQLRGVTIAAVNGACFGGALDLALACHRRIASADAVFSHPGANLGIITGWGGTQRLPRLIGQANALEMFFTAARVDAASALRLGLIDQVAADPLEHALLYEP